LEQLPNRCMTILDNVEVAILTRVNELAVSHGLKPYEFVAYLKHGRDQDTDKFILYYSVPTSGSQAKEAKFDRMLKSIGIAAGSLSLMGTDKELIDALDGAISRGPRGRC
jgi:hypothetical protein